MADMAQLFVTDYASYNNGSQFEFGKWVDLSEFSDVDEFNEYIQEYFSNADEKSPLSCGSKREEIMFSDFEGFPKELYSECGDLTNLFEYLNLEDHQRPAVEFMIEQNCDMAYALENYENVSMHSNTGDGSKWELFEMCYPDAEKVENSNPYVTINYDLFISERYTEFTDSEGNNYFVCDSWNA